MLSLKGPRTNIHFQKRFFPRTNCFIPTSKIKFSNVPFHSVSVTSDIDRSNWHTKWTLLGGQFRIKMPSTNPLNGFSDRWSSPIVKTQGGVDHTLVYSCLCNWPCLLEHPNDFHPYLNKRHYYIILTRYQFIYVKIHCRRLCFFTIMNLILWGPKGISVVAGLLWRFWNAGEAIILSWCGFYTMIQKQTIFVFFLQQRVWKVEKNDDTNHYLYIV